jgi:hypothetical protein
MITYPAKDSEMDTNPDAADIEDISDVVYAAPFKMQTPAGASLHRHQWEQLKARVNLANHEVQTLVDMAEKVLVAQEAKTHTSGEHRSGEKAEKSVQKGRKGGGKGREKVWGAPKGGGCEMTELELDALAAEIEAMGVMGVSKPKKGKKGK